MRDFTDSYCERCGTRYTFGEPPPKGMNLHSARVLARGLKNFVMNDGTTMDEAMSAARIDEEQTQSTRVTEEFHKVFNFCMTCRQYACDKCWNPNQGACLSCAPLWNEEPVVPEGHIILRTPTAHREVGPIVGARPAEPEQWLAEPAPWLSEAGRAPEPPAPPQATRGHGRAERAPAPEPPVAEPAPQAAEPAPEIQPPIRTPLDRRAIARDQRAAQRLQNQAAAWKQADDGWALWPAGEEGQAPSSAGPDLTQQERLLVQAELDNPSPYEDPDLQPPPAKRSRSRQQEPSEPAPQGDFDLIGSLRGPAIDVPAPAPARAQIPQQPRSQPAGRQPASRPSQRPSALPSSGRAVSQPAPEQASAPAAEPSRAPVLGRLLGQQAKRVAAAAEAAVRPPKPRAGKGKARESAEQAAPAWPQPTPWTARRLDRPAPDLQNQEPSADQPRFAESAAPAARPASSRRSSSPPAPPAVQPEARPPAPPASSEMPPDWLERPATYASPARTPEPEQQRPGGPQLQSPATWIARAMEGPPPVPSAAQPAPQTPPAPAPQAAPASQPAPARQPAPPQAAWPPAPSTDRWAQPPQTQWQPAAPPRPAQEPAPWQLPEEQFQPPMPPRSRSQAKAEAEAEMQALWAESAQQVMNRGAARVCYRCALPLSTHARFCRRCGTEQSL